MYITGYSGAITELPIQDPIRQELVQNRSEKNIPMPLLPTTGFLNPDPTDRAVITHQLLTPEADRVQDLKQPNLTDLLQDPATQFLPKQSHQEQQYHHNL